MGNMFPRGQHKKRWESSPSNYMLSLSQTNIPRPKFVGLKLKGESPSNSRTRCQGKGDKAQPPNPFRQRRPASQLPPLPRMLISGGTLAR